MLTFHEISGKEMDAFSKDHPLGNIHQTSAWAKFQKGVKGRGKTLICGVKDEEGSLRAAAVLVRQELPMGLCWYFVPRGPLFKEREELDALIEGIKPLLKQEKCVFLRFEWPNGENVECGMLNIGVKAHAHYFPENTLEIKLRAEIEDILRQMKQKGRYNIKVARRHEVKVEKSTDVEAFFEIFKETTERDGFSGHGEGYYRDMIEALGDRAELWLAKYKGKVLAGAVVTYYRNTATYYFGASSSEDRKVMAPYLLHWEIMRDAKGRGLKWYDLFGVAPEDGKLRMAYGLWRKEHPWAGVTGFKEKFGGVRIDYWPSRELVLKWGWYLVMRLRKLFGR